MSVWNQCQSHSRDIICADGVPIVGAFHPPEFGDGFTAAEDVQTRLEDAALYFFAETFAERLREFVIQPCVDGHDGPAAGGAAQIRIALDVVEIEQLAIMGGHEPAAHVAELFKTTDDFRQETAFVFQTFRDGQCLDFWLPTMVDVFISGSYAGSMEIQIEFVRHRLLRCRQNLFSTGDDDIGGGIGRKTAPCGAIMEGEARLPQFIRKHGLQFSDALR